MSAVSAGCFDAFDEVVRRIENEGAAALVFVQQPELFQPEQVGAGGLGSDAVGALVAFHGIAVPGVTQCVAEQGDLAMVETVGKGRRIQQQAFGAALLVDLAREIALQVLDRLLNDIQLVDDEIGLSLIHISEPTRPY